MCYIQQYYQLNESFASCWQKRRECDANKYLKKSKCVLQHAAVVGRMMESDELQVRKRRAPAREKIQTKRSRQDATSSALAEIEGILTDYEQKAQSSSKSLDCTSVWLAMNVVLDNSTFQKTLLAHDVSNKLQHNVVPTEDCHPLLRSWLRVSPGSLLSGTRLSYGASAVARTSDRGHVAEALSATFNSYCHQPIKPRKPCTTAQRCLRPSILTAIK